MPDNQTSKNMNTGDIDKLAPKRSFWASFRSLSDWLNLICLLITLGIVIWSVEQARWVRPSPSFMTIFVSSVLIGFILAKSRLPALVSHILALIIGVPVVFWQGLLLTSGPDLASRIWPLISNIQAWWHSQTSGVPSTGTIHIALIFGCLTWIIGYFSTYPLIRKRNPWIAVLLGTVVILVNLNFWVKDKYYYFILYLIAALVLVAITTYTKNNSQLTSSKYKGINWGTKLWLAAALCLIVISASLTWVSPGFRIATIDNYAKANSPFKGTFEIFWQNFFATVPGSGAPMLMHGGQQEIQLGGSLKLSDQVDFIIKTDHENYWKTQVYDIYNSTGWQTSATDNNVIDNEIPGTGNTTAFPSDVLRRQLSYTLIPQVNTNVVPTTGDFISGSIPIVRKTLTPMVFEINLLDSSNDTLLPPDIASAAKVIRASRSTNRRTDPQIAALLPIGLKLVSINRSGFTIQSISITRDQPEDKAVIALSSAQIIQHQDKVTITVQIPSDVSPKELEAAGTTYPKPITDRYLQLPSTLPSRVRELAINITQDSKNPYQKAQAIKEYLANYQYSLTIDAPPDGADGVDYFLFTQKMGYCTYFASAMTVLLRSVDVPARMVVGFLPGQYDSEAQNYIIRDRDYHAWTEVYFPKYGWIIFDATPNNATGSSGSSSEISSGNIDTLNPDFTQGTAPEGSSSTINYGRYIGLSASAVVGIIILLILIFCLRIYSRPKNASVIYSRMVLLASMAGLGPQRWQTALEFSSRLSTALPQQSRNIDNITQTYVIACYGNEASSKSSGENLRSSWPELRHSLLKRLFRIS